MNVRRPFDRLDPVLRRRLGWTMLELRGRGMGYEAIAVVLELYEGVEVSEWHVRAEMYRLGVKKNPARVAGQQRAMAVAR